MSHFHIEFSIFIVLQLIVLYLFWQIFKRKNSGLQTSLHETNERFSSFFAQASEALNISNLNDELLFVNPAFEALYGWTKEELIGKKLPFIPAELAAESERIKEELLAGNKVTHWDAQFVRKDGTRLDVCVSISPLRDADGVITGFAAVTRDISERKKLEQKLTELAFYDPLTGVGNRYSFFTHLTETVAAAKESDELCALLYLDCDHFKTVNDTLGHCIGDRLLQQFTKRVREVLPSGSDLYRLGGDEFAVILGAVREREEIVDIAKEIVCTLETPWKIQDESFATTVSLGISVYPLDSDDEQSLVSHADNALYAAKAAGRNQYCFYQDEQTSLSHVGTANAVDLNQYDLFQEARQELERWELLLAAELKQAIANEHFHLAYQPEINLQTGAVECFEVLLRFDHPVLGSITPHEFIPIAEEAGLIDELTIWVLEQVSKQAQHWQDSGFTTTHFAINMSPLIFQREQSFNVLRNAFTSGGILPDCLEIEITEELFLDNLFDIMDKLETLRNMGVMVSVDDFGTHDSASINLKHLPIDKIKIDKSIINGTFAQSDAGERNQQLIAAIIASAQENGISIAGIGIETQQQSDFLIGSGVEIGQGYFFSKPLDAKEVEQLGFLRARGTVPSPLELGDSDYGKQTK